MAKEPEKGLQAEGEPASSETSRVLLLDRSARTFVFENVKEPPIPSLLRGFSAPVRLDYPYSNEELATLLAHDEDAFVRWEAGQQLALREMARQSEDPALSEKAVAEKRKELEKEMEQFGHVVLVGGGLLAN